MKKMILGIAALLMISFVFAQPAPGKSHMGKRGHHSMEMRQLNLTDAQMAQLKTINQEFHQQMQELNNKESITVKEQRDQRNALARAHKDKVESVLTPAQKNQLVQLKKERKAKMDSMGVKRLAKLKKELNLSDAQVTAIRKNQATAKNRTETLLKNESMSREAKREQLGTIRKEMKASMDQVLTPEQKEKLEALQKERHKKGKNLKDHRRNHHRGGGIV